MTTVLDRPIAPELAPTPAVEPPSLPDVLVVDIMLDDIALGCRYDGRECAVARAVRRQGFEDVMVAPSFGVAFGRDFPRRVHYRQTPEFKRWVLDFDHSRPVGPARFDLPRCPGCAACL